jgi:hypothetical protein
MRRTGPSSKVRGKGDSSLDRGLLHESPKGVVL